MDGFIDGGYPYSGVNFFNPTRCGLNLGFPQLSLSRRISLSAGRPVVIFIYGFKSKIQHQPI
jgi:hypothetical protein